MCGGGYGGSSGGDRRRATAAAATGVAAAVTEEERPWQRLSEECGGGARSRRGEPNNVTKTGADGGVPTPREAAWRIPWKVDARRRRWTAGRSATVRRGDATAAGESRRRREDLGAAAGTSYCGTTAQWGDAVATRGLVQPRRRPWGGSGDRVSRHYGPKGRCTSRCSREENHGAVALRPDRGDAAAARCSIGGGAH